MTTKESETVGEVGNDIPTGFSGQIIEVCFLSIQSNTMQSGRRLVYLRWKEDGSQLQKKKFYRKSIAENYGIKAPVFCRIAYSKFDHLTTEIRTKAVHTRIVGINLYLFPVEGNPILVAKTPDLTENHIFGTESFAIGEFKLFIYTWTIQMVKNDEDQMERHHTIDFYVEYKKQVDDHPGQKKKKKAVKVEKADTDIDMDQH